MLYTLLCYNDESVTSSWTEEEDARVMARLKEVQRKHARHFGPIARLAPTTAATTYRKQERLVTDGPFAETKEQLLGFYVLDVTDKEHALSIVRDLAEANPGGAYEIRPIQLFFPDGSASGAGAAQG